MVGKNRVLVYLNGGLGNQFFQYYAGLSLALRLDLPLVLDTSYAKLSNSHSSSTIEDLRLDPRVTIKESRNLLSYLSFWARSYLRGKNGGSYKLFQLVLRIIFNLHVSPEIGFDSRLEKFRPGIKLDGYFQTWRYLDIAQGLKSTPLSERRLVAQTSYFERMFSEISRKQTLAIHVRRGDYINGRNTLGILSSEYYSNSIQALRDKGVTWEQILLFTDDVNTVKIEFQELLKQEQIIIVDEPDESRPLESLILMSAASSLIIANSTFSWWAAVFGHEKDAIICPTKWFKGLEDPDDLYPKNWLKVEPVWT